MMRLIVVVILASLSCFAQSDKSERPECGETNNTSASSAYRGSRGNAPAGNVSKLPIRGLLYAGAETRIYTRYMPWFGDKHHRGVGYRSDDERQVARQVADMVSRGIQGAIVDWYGPSSGSKNESTLLLLKEAEKQNFEFAVSEDAGALAECKKHGCNLTEQLISDLRYAEEHYESSPAYIRFEDRPAVFFFGLESYSIDWRRVRSSLPLKPFLFFRNSGAFSDQNADGAYTWIAPETAGPEDPMGMKYLDRFYTKGQSSSKIAMGSAYKGFDDAEASWGKGRVIDQQCGQTWLATFKEASRFYSSRHQLPALIIPTWNDYEEGTEIETGIDNCVRIQASLGGQNLSWTISGDENMIDHYSVLVQRGSEWSEAADVPAGTHTVSLGQLNAKQRPAKFCVEAVGKPSMQNQFSEPVHTAAADR